MEDIIVPIFICCILPLGVVFAIFGAKMNADNKRAQVLIKAIESNAGVNTDKLAEALRKPRKTARQILNSRLLWGCLFSFVGIVLCIVGIVSACMGNSTFDASVSLFLIFGGVCLAVGLSFLTVYFVTRRQIKE